MDNEFLEVEDLKAQLTRRAHENRKQFPQDNKDYSQIYTQIEDYMNRDIHPNVVSGAATHGDGLLNDHGVDHIAMVIQRASLLLGSNAKRLCGYEIFLLLLAIHFHDVGNIDGRVAHETRILEVINDSSYLSSMLDTPTRNYVVAIAMAHGGVLTNGSKDTISAIVTNDTLNGITIRPRVLAAILRLADEIADDKNRAPRFLIDSKRIPEGNEIYHKYSAALQPAAIHGNTLILKFDFSIDNGTQLYGKIDSSGIVQKEFLYDEILQRLKKCLCEIEYCNKYSMGLLPVSAISATINVFVSHKIDPIHVEYLKLQICGYPNIASGDIIDLLQEKPTAINGAALKKILEENSEAEI